jgi:hypothetical protein
LEFKPRPTRKVEEEPVATPSKKRSAEETADGVAKKIKGGVEVIDLDSGLEKDVKGGIEVIALDDD